MRQELSLLLLSLFIFVFGVITSQVVEGVYFDETEDSKVALIRQKGFKYISPLIRCETPFNADNKRLISLENELYKYLTSSQENGLANDVSVYFRVPETGDWIAVNENEKYTPASMLKVPTMIAYYKESQSNPNVLSKQITFDINEIPIIEQAKIQTILESGKAYTVEELIKLMITQSDNQASSLLSHNINTNEYHKIFAEIGINPIDTSNTENFMTVKDFVAFFRTLYNSTYLNRKMSEKALELLSQTTFTKGITAGVPQNVTVAHKFGERAYDHDATKQLHDCGLVYYPNHPYILCVMTRGSDFDSLSQVIGTVSKITFEEVDSWFRKQ